MKREFLYTLQSDHDNWKRRVKEENKQYERTHIYEMTLPSRQYKDFNFNLYQKGVADPNELVDHKAKRHVLDSMERTVKEPW